jgi:hypothetical protein
VDQLLQSPRRKWCDISMAWWLKANLESVGLRYHGLGILGTEVFSGFFV